MTGQKGQSWKKEKVNKYTITIRVTKEQYNNIIKIVKKKDWTKTKVAYKIFERGYQTYI